MKKKMLGRRVTWSKTAWTVCGVVMSRKGVFLTLERELDLRRWETTVRKDEVVFQDVKARRK